MKALTPQTITAFLLLLFFVPKPVQAAVRCETQYGGGEVCVRTGNLQIDKEVWNNATDKQFIDNTDTLFAPKEEVRFKLRVKNVGDSKFDKVNVSDVLPSFLELVSGSLSYEITDLDPGETDEREIVTKVVSDNRFPKEGETKCDVNSGEAWSGDERDKDTSRLCVGKKVLGAKVLPKAGPENWLPLLSLNLIIGTIGLTLLKIKKNSS